MKIDRLLSLINLLSVNDRMTANDLAERLEVSKRTIYRDIDTLNVAGIPIISYSGISGGFGMVEGYKVSKHIFSTADIANLLTGLSAIQSISESAEISPLIAKISPKENSQQLQSDLLIDLSSWFKESGRQNKLNDLRQGIANQQVIAIYYHSTKYFTERKIEPYKLIFKASDWYLYGFCLKRQAFRLFKLTRIQSYEVLEETFDSRPLEPAILQMSSRNEYQEVATKSKIQQAVLVYALKDKLWLIDKLGAEFFVEHKEEVSTGKIIFPLVNIERTVDFILRLQAKVQVVEPPELVEAVKAKIEEMYLLYKS